MKSFLLSIFLGFASIYGYSQNFEVTGNVVDSNGTPLPGVTIVVKNTMNGASTDFDGNFTISNLQKGDVLVWHANLIHGGEPQTNPESTRKSMVFHYYAQDAICYHEITQRPSLMK